MAKKAATPTTVTLKHLAAAIADEQELSKKQAEAILNDFWHELLKTYDTGIDTAKFQIHLDAIKPVMQQLGMEQVPGQLSAGLQQLTPQQPPGALPYGQVPVQ